MRESKIETYLCKKVKEIGGLCIKMSPEFNAGIPDRLILIRGRSFFVELKATGKKPRKLQVKYAEKLKKVGFETIIIDSKSIADELIKNIR